MPDPEIPECYQVAPRLKSLILRAMNDGMWHKQQPVIDFVLERTKDKSISEMSEDEFIKFAESINGHGGLNVKGLCSTCKTGEYG